MTPQDIRDRTFEKAVFGGYDMGGVDDFMEEAAVELEAVQKENVTLKAKLKLLVEKIEEYRASEDAMRLTLLSAQKLSAQIEEEARQRAEKTIADADAVAARSLDSLKNEIVQEQVRLDAAKAACADFLRQARALCAAQVEQLDRIATAVPGGRSEGAVEAAVKSIEASVARIPDEPAPRIDISSAMSESAPRQTITPDDVTHLFSMGQG